MPPVCVITSYSIHYTKLYEARLIFEAYIRGLWLSQCASEQEIEDYKTDKLEKNFSTLIKENEELDGFKEGVLSTVKKITRNNFV